MLRSRAVTLQIPFRDSVSVYPLGDIHLGAGECDEELLARTVAAIQVDPHAYWIGMGDYIDAINMRDPRFEAGGLAPWLYSPLGMSDIIGAQLERLVDRYLGKIAHKCLGLVYGNHEAKAAKYSERNIAGEIAARLRGKRGDNDNTLMLGYEGWVLISARKAVKAKNPPTLGRLKIYAHHGAGAASTRGGKLNRLVKAMTPQAADLVLMGHVHHQTHATRVLYDMDNRGKVVRRVQLGMVTGTFLGQSEYGVQKGYEPLLVGAPYATWKPATGDLTPNFAPVGISWKRAA